MKKIASVAALLCLNACNAPAPLEKGMESVKRWLGMAVATPTPSPSPAQSAHEALTKKNAEMLAEMVQVTFQEEFDENTFASLVSSLNQGASLEGIYRGLIMGSRYRVLESNSKAASPNAVQFFASEMTSLQSEMKRPTLFSKETAKKIPTIEYPEGGDAVPESYSFGNDPKKQSEEELLGSFLDATPYTLKRVLCEEALKKMEEMKASSSDLAQWYAKLAVRLAATGVDFGLPQRRSTDFDFHVQFASKMPADRVKWEVLNRYQRILNGIR